MRLKEYTPYYLRNLKIALPIMVTQAGQVLVQMVDNIMVGHLGAAELAGVSFANAIFFIGFDFLVGFSMGITPVIGQYFGKNQHEKISAVFSNGMILNLVVGILTTLLMAGVGTQLYRMGQEEEVLQHGLKYYNVMLLSYIPTALFFSIRYFSDGIGNTKNAMYITVSTNLLNIFLNWIFIYGHLGVPSYGVEGAAIATLLSRIVSLILFVILLFRVGIYQEYVFQIRRPLLSPDLLKELTSTSLPISMQNLAEITAFSFTAIMVGWMGTYELAAHEIAYSLCNLVFMIAMGIGSAATIRVSHNFGSDDFVGVRKAGTASIHMAIFIMSINALIFLLFHNFIPKIYTDDALVYPIAGNLIIILGLFQIFDALQLSSMSSLRGLKDIKVPMIYSFIAYYVICLPMGYLLGFTCGLGPEGIWIGLLLGLLCVGIFFWRRFNRLTEKLIRNGHL